MFDVVLGRWGRCKYFLKDEYVGRSVRNYGEYGPDETERVLELVGEAGEGLCLDIGANIGCISQALIKAGREVLAFEPQPVVAGVCRENIGYAMAEGLGSGSVIECALGAEEGMAEMPYIDYSAKANIGGCGIGIGGAWSRKIPVPVRRLDAIEGIKGRVAFIKMDVEGFEEQALRGGAELIRRDRPIMYIEDDRMEKSASLRKYIKELGYSIEEHKPTLYREKNFFGLARNIWDKNYASHNLICRPC